MPPTLTFLQVTAHSSIPVRVFVNRKQVLSSAPVSINEKSVINISNTVILKISNEDLTGLLEDIRDQLIEILVHKDFDELLKYNQGTKLVFEDVGVKWKCKVVVTLNFIMAMRFQLNLLKSSDITYINENNINMRHICHNELNDEMKLLKREILLLFPQHDSDDDFSDEKKLTDYKLKRLNLSNNKLYNGLVLYVHQRPSRKG